MIQSKVIFRHTFGCLRSCEIEGESDERRKKGGWISTSLWGARAVQQRGWNSRVYSRIYVHIEGIDRPEHAQTHILRRTSVFKHAWWEGGARGWNRDPIVLRCEACARKGVDRETIGGGGERDGWRREETWWRKGEKGRFAHAARAAFTKGWNRLEAIHSFGCPVFFPRVWLGEHRRPPSCRFSSLFIYSLCRILCLQVRSITISFLFLFFLFFFLSFFFFNFKSLIVDF